MRKGKWLALAIALLDAALLFGLWFQAGETAVEPEDPYEKKIALTFDDGPHPYYTEMLLDGLAERGVKATFFLIGVNIEGREDLIRRMHEDGHLIGSHTYSHVQLTTLDLSAACEEICRTNEVIAKITGETPVYIRPPYGSWSEEMECAVDMTVVLWSVDPRDWQSQNKDTVVRHIVKNTEEGDIILLHDVYKSSVEAALEVVDRLKAEGYVFVTADEMILD
ncbi:MAG: polysaccharide deacetylase family protein [Lachnospiraceae bacterium]|nr:polysaccharide deacetylase family protein [Lachnospiraceae bacterium]